MFYLLLVLHLFLWTIYKLNLMYVWRKSAGLGFSPIHCFRHPLRFLESLLPALDWATLLFFLIEKKIKLLSCWSGLSSDASLSWFLFKVLMYTLTISPSGTRSALTDGYYVMLLHFGLRSCLSASRHYFETNSKRLYSVLLHHRRRDCSHLGTAQQELQAKSGMNLSKE